MKHFISISDVGDPEPLAEEALMMKSNPEKWRNFAAGKSICLIFFNPSLRTRLSSIRAAEILGMTVTVFNVGKDGWQLELEDGTVMDKGKAEHIKEAAGVISAYFDLIGVRSFADLKNRDKDYRDAMISGFVNYSSVPIVSLESTTLHPLQSLADLATIREFAVKKRPKVVLSWTPHPRALPQAVANSFSQWMMNSDVEFVVTHPKGLELDPGLTGKPTVEYNRKSAFEGADFVYAKNWSTFEPYGEIASHPDWIIDEKIMAHTNDAGFMHCLPVRRNVVVSDSVLDSPSSLIIPQATNRIWSAATVFKNLLS